MRSLGAPIEHSRKESSGACSFGIAPIYSSGRQGWRPVRPGSQIVLGPRFQGHSRGSGNYKRHDLRSRGKGRWSMMDYLYPNFLKDPREYEQTQRLWQSRWQDLVDAAGKKDRWESP